MASKGSYKGSVGNKDDDKNKTKSSSGGGGGNSSRASSSGGSTSFSTGVKDVISSLNKGGVGTTVPIPSSFRGSGTSSSPAGYNKSTFTNTGVGGSTVTANSPGGRTQTVTMDNKGKNSNRSPFASYDAYKQLTYDSKPGEFTARALYFGATGQTQRGRDVFNSLQQEFMNFDSPLYQPYYRGTSKAIASLAQLGVQVPEEDVRGWLSANGEFVRQNKRETESTYNPTKTKRSSKDQQIAYWLYQLEKDQDFTEKAQQEWADLQKELSYKANRLDWNMSDDEIISSINWKKYPSLAKMDAGIEMGTYPELTQGMDYSRDNLYGVLFAARNPENASDNAYINTGWYYTNAGNTYLQNDAVRNASNPNSPDFNPYRYGPSRTTDDTMEYFGVSSIDQKFLDDHKYMMNSADEKERTMYANAVQYYNNWEKIEAQAKELEEVIKEGLKYHPHDAQGLIDYVFGDGSVYEDLDMLQKVDESYLGKDGKNPTGKFVGTAQAISYDRKYIEDKIREICGPSYNDYSGAEQISYICDKLGVDKTGITYDPLVDHEMDNAINESAGYIAQNGTPEEQDVFKNAYLYNYDNYTREVADAIVDGRMTSQEAYDMHLGYANDLCFKSYAEAKQTVGRYESLRKEKDALIAQLTPSNVDVPEDEQYTEQVRQENFEIQKQIEEIDAELLKLTPDHDEALDTLKKIDQSYEFADRIAALGAVAVPEDQKYEARAMIDYISQFDGELRLPEYSAYSAYEMDLESGTEDYASIADRAKNDIVENNITISSIDYFLKWITDNNVDVPERAIENMKTMKEQLERNVSDSEYFLVQNNDDFESVVAAKKKEIKDKFAQRNWFEKSVFGLGSWDESEIASAIAMPDSTFGFGLSDGNGLHWTETEENTYMYLYAKEGKEKADEFANFLKNRVKTREYENIQQWWRDNLSGGNKVDSFGEHVASGIVGTLTKPFADITSALYTIGQMATGNKIYTKDPMFALSNVITDMRGETKEALQNKFDDPNMKAVMGFLHDISTSALDSLYTGSLAGMMGLSSVVSSEAFFSGAKSGLVRKIGEKLPKSLNAFFAASLQGSATISQTAQDLAQRGIDDTTAYWLACSINFMAETATEAIEVSDILNIDDSASFKALWGDGKKFQAICKLCQIDDAFGESASEFISGLSDYIIAEKAAKYDLSTDEGRRQFLKDIIYSGFSGAVSAGLSSGVSSFTRNVVNSRNEKQAKLRAQEQEQQTRQRIEDMINNLDFGNGPRNQPQNQQNQTQEQTQEQTRQEPDWYNRDTEDEEIEYVERDRSQYDGRTTEDITSELTELVSRIEQTKKDLAEQYKLVDQKDKKYVRDQNRDILNQLDEQSRGLCQELADRYVDTYSRLKDLLNANGGDMDASAIQLQAEADAIDKTLSFVGMDMNGIRQNIDDMITSRSGEEELEMPETNNTQISPEQAQMIRTVNALFNADQTGDQAARSITLSSVLALSNSDRSVTPMDRAGGMALARDYGDKIHQLSYLLLSSVENGQNFEDVANALSVAALKVDGTQSGRFLDLLMQKNDTHYTKEEIDGLIQRSLADISDPLLNTALLNKIVDYDAAFKVKDKIAEGRRKNSKAASKRAKVAKDQARQAADKLAESQRHLSAAQENLNAVSQEFHANPADSALFGAQSKAQQDVVGRVNEVESNRKSAQVAQNTANEAQKDADEIAGQEMAEIRQEARAEAEQEMAEMQQERAEQRQAEAEAQQEQAEMEHDTANNASLDADSFIEEYYPDTSEEEKNKIRQRFGEMSAEQMDPDKAKRRERFVRRLGQKFGVRIEIADTSEGGTKMRINGSYDESTNTITLDSTVTQSDAIYAIALHELTHMAERSGYYQEFADAIMQLAYSDENGNFDRQRMLNDINAKRKLYDAKLKQMALTDSSVSNKPFSSADASKEIVADLTRKILFGDQESIDNLVGKNPNVAQRMLEGIKNFIKKIARIDDPAVVQLRKTRDMFTKALKNAQKNLDTGNTQYSLPIEQLAEREFKDSKIRDEDGALLPVYHGTDAQFTTFDMSKGRANMDIQGSFFSPWKEDADGYGSNVGKYYLNIKNPASEAEGYKALRKFQGQNEAGKKAREYLISKGYDGVNNSNEEFIAFYPEQIKSAEEITYDDEGNPIPENMRFDTGNKDIRYSLPSDNILDEQISEFLSRDVRADVERAVADHTVTIPAAPVNTPQGRRQQQHIQSGHDIIQRLSSAIGVPIDPRRSKFLRNERSRAEGYITNAKIPHIQDASMVEIAMHEIGHVISRVENLPDRLDTRGLLRNMMSIPQEARFLSNYYNPNDIAGSQQVIEEECRAEFAKFWALDRDYAVQLAGQEFVDQWENLLNDRGWLRPMQEASVQLRLNRAQTVTDAERAKSYIHLEDQNNDRRQTPTEWVRKALTQVADYTHPLQQLTDENRRRQGENYRRDLDPRELALSRATASNNLFERNMFETMVDSEGNTVYRADGTEYGSFQHIIQQIRDEDEHDFLTLWSLLDGRDRGENGKDTFGDDFNIDRAIQQLQEAHPEFMPIIEQAEEWYEKFMETWLVNEDNQSAEAFRHMRELYPYYIPSIVDVKDRKVDSNRNHRGDQPADTGLRYAGGHKGAAVKNPIVMMAQYMQSYISKAKTIELHRAFDTTMTESLRDDPEWANGIAELTQPDMERQNAFDANRQALAEINHEIREIMREQGISWRDYLRRRGVQYSQDQNDADRQLKDLTNRLRNVILNLPTQVWHESDRATGPDVINVRRADGTLASWTVYNKEIYDALTKMPGAKPVGTFLRAIHAFMGFFSANVTARDIGFSFMNFLSDTDTAVNYGHSRGNYIGYMSQLLRNTFRYGQEMYRASHGQETSDTYRKFITFGKLGSRYAIRNPNTQRELRNRLYGHRYTIRDRVGRNNIRNRVGRIVHSPIAGVEFLSGFLEDATRFNAFANNYRDGGSYSDALRAGRYAREDSTDFSKIGKEENINPVLKKFVPFVGPAEQGIAKTVETLVLPENREERNKLLRRTALNAVIRGVAIAALRGLFWDDEDKEAYDEVRDSEKSKYFHIKFGHGDNARFFRVKRSQDMLIQTAENIGEMIGRTFTGWEDDPGAAIFTIGKNAAMNTAISFDAVWEPFNDAMNNVNFQGIPLDSGSDLDKPPQDRWDAETPYPFRMMSSLSNVFGIPFSPAGWRYLTEEFTGSMGRIGINIFENLTNDHQGPPSAVGEALYDYAARKFTIDPVYSNGLSETYYAGLDKLDQVLANADTGHSIVYFRSNLSKDEVTAGLKEAKEMKSSSSRLGVIGTQIAELRSKEKEVLDDNSKTESARDAEARSIRMERNKLMLEANAIIGDYFQKYGYDYAVQENLMYAAATFNLAHPEKVESNMIPQSNRAGYVTPETMHDVFKADSNMPYMQKAMELYESTQNAAALPHPKYTGSYNKVKYEVTEQYQNDFDKKYRDAYNSYVKKKTRAWDRMTEDEKKNVMANAHNHAQHEAAQWYARLKR